MNSSEVDFESHLEAAAEAFEEQIAMEATARIEALEAALEREEDKVRRLQGDVLDLRRRVESFRRELRQLLDGAEDALLEQEERFVVDTGEEEAYLQGLGHAWDAAKKAGLLPEADDGADS